MNQWKLILLIGVSLIFFAGCGQKRPDGIPPLYSATVTVTNSGAPISEANVLLVAQGGTSGSWAVNGTTDAQGIAVINTSQGDWKAKGAPEGEYKVYITKLPDFEQDPLPEEAKNDSDLMQRYSQEQMRKMQAAPKIIPETLTTPTTTPLTITVSSDGKAGLTVDISKYE